MTDRQMTPGPWRYVKNTGIVTSDECNIGHIGDFKDKELLPFNKDRWEADARLIAAAPDLLAALESLRPIWEQHAPTRLLRAAETAIAKARGQSI
jgi:hypothetical protein